MDYRRLVLQLRLVEVVVEAERNRGTSLPPVARRGLEIVERAVSGVDLNAVPELAELVSRIRRELGMVAAEEAS